MKIQDLLLKYNVVRNTDLWIKLSETIYDDRDVIKSGWDEIEGNKLTELKIQLRYKLMDSIEYDFTDWECKKLYNLAMYDLLTSSECKIAIMLMAQKLGNIPIPKED